MEKFYALVTNDECGELVRDLKDAEYDDYQALSKEDTYYCLIESKSLKEFLEENPKYKELCDKLDDGKHECYNCGCISNRFFLDYRGEESVGKVHNCVFCHGLNDKHYNIIGRKRNIRNYI